MKRATKPAKIIAAPAARKKPPICAARMAPISPDTREITTYAVCLPSPIMLLLQKHRSKKRLNWKNPATTIHTAFNPAISFAKRRRKMESQRATRARSGKMECL
jgi:hypothetical protein